MLSFTEYKVGFAVGCGNGVEAMETDGVEGTVFIQTMCIVSVGVHSDWP
jgi:hypothetical protein